MYTCQTQFPSDGAQSEKSRITINTFLGNKSDKDLKKQKYT